VLRPQCFAVLRFLLRNPSRLVTKDELMAAVWPGTVVTDDSLVQCVHEIRRALGDEDHTVLKTAPRRGYRLVLPTEIPNDIATSPHPEPVASHVAPPPAQGPRLLDVATAAGIALVVVAALVAWWLMRAQPTDPTADGRPTIAVLPFDNLGDDPQQVYFADGITEDLITDLSKISGVFVIARNSVWPYRDRSVDVREVARELGVRYVLEGSVRREGDQLRINAQLIDAAEGHHLWAERYDGGLGDVFALQDKVIANIISALAVALSSEEAAASSEAETVNPQAYDALLLGLDHLRMDTEEDTAEAVMLFEKAIALDPGYSRAYAAAAAAQLRIVLSIWLTTAGAGLDRAYNGLQMNLARAMEEPTPLALWVAAVWAQHTGRYDDAFNLIGRAEAMAPNDAEVLVSKAHILTATGRAPEAERELGKAQRLDPRFSPRALRALSISLHAQRKYEEAVQVIERIVAQEAATTDDYLTLVSSLGHLGRSEGVKEAIESYNALAVPAAWDPMSVAEGQWYWNGPLLGYHRPYVEQLVEGLRKAGVPEGVGTAVPFAQYAGLIKRVRVGEFDVDGATEIEPAEAKALLERGVKFVDVRAKVDYESGHVPDAINLSLVFDLTREALANVAGPDEEVVFYCHTKYCEYSAYAAAKAIVWGYRRVYRFAGGFPAWKNAGYPIEDGPTQ
jgi:TolB-like protein/DNA-binding winged helix-turn-helix (wHTH) protein/rhodanese-related sulfurtransferase